MKNPTYCVIDYETFSEIDLRKVGAYEYSAHKSTEVMCVAWKIGTKDKLKESKTFWATPMYPKAGDGWEAFKAALKVTAKRGVVFLAHNAFFEQCITKNVVGVNIPINQWRCTAAQAAALGLPRKLEHVAKVLKLSHQKDMEGNRLTLKWCKPRKPSKNNPKTRWDDKDELKTIIKYCKSDVDTQTDLFLTIPPLSDFEQRVWFLDQEINFRGFKVDRELIEKILKLIDEEVKALNQETLQLTEGQLSSTTKRDQTLRWLERNGIALPDLRAGTVKEVLQSQSLNQKGKRLLEIRQAISKTSTKKYQSLELRSRTDSQIRGSLMYHAAHHGRWAGSGVQPQNMSRPTIPQWAIEGVLSLLKEDL